MRRKEIEGYIRAMRRLAATFDELDRTLPVDGVWFDDEVVLAHGMIAVIEQIPTLVEDASGRLLKEKVRLLDTPSEPGDTGERPMNLTWEMMDLLMEWGGRIDGEEALESMKKIVSFLTSYKSRRRN